MVSLYKMGHYLSIQLSTCIGYYASERWKGCFWGGPKCVVLFLHGENDGMFPIGLGCFLP